MELMETIENRRSIRKFSERPIPREELERVLQAAIEAPSAKNRQPWRFVVLSGKSKEQMLGAMREGIIREREGDGLLPASRRFLSGADYTVSIMEQAPVVVFVLNTEPHFLGRDSTMEDQLFEAANLQSIGASIQNLLLAAQNRGLGSLWICDIFFAYRELSAFLKTQQQLVAAVALGYPEEAPRHRPRKKLASVVEWYME